MHGGIERLVVENISKSFNTNVEGSQEKAVGLREKIISVGKVRKGRSLRGKEWQMERGGGDGREREGREGEGREGRGREREASEGRGEWGQ